MTTLPTALSQLNGRLNKEKKKMRDFVCKNGFSYQSQHIIGRIVFENLDACKKVEDPIVMKNKIIDRCKDYKAIHSYFRRIENKRVYKNELEKNGYTKNQVDNWEIRNYNQPKVWFNPKKKKTLSDFLGHVIIIKKS